ncbi:type II toxin-antitoxin system HicB family antitoxin [Photorhabdus sp. CRCIA-P01]|uniref:type II toxin-antitoxin system HicB family antitoxin n=1 Tax=Photorhabdus sp. CRCIA-P01 TaxID=2019570 RepID=UPI001E5B2D10|nr:type II toxin-antitoxin system HicB family antitoxin [Photorhabdus sp. CRCIA-P01]
MFFSVGVELPKDENTAYGLIIPALCTEKYGCFSATDNRENIAIMAREAILLTVEDMVANNSAVEHIQDTGYLVYAKNTEYQYVDSWFVINVGLGDTVNLAKSAVPSSRKINGKALTGDVSLNAGDVGAQPTGNYAVRGESYTKGESDGKYQPRGNYQPAGDYAVRGESYIKRESDERYRKSGVNTSWVRVGGAGLEGCTITFSRDVRGSTLFVKNKQ